MSRGNGSGKMAARTCLLTFLSPQFPVDAGPVTARMLKQLVLLCMCVCVSVRASPLRTSYDQRQHGELNIHAQLDNIVVLIIPTSNINMMELGLKNKYHQQEKPQGLLQFLQKFKDEMATVNNEISPVVTSSQEVVLNNNLGQNNEEKEEEVVATIEEMKPNTSAELVEPPKEEVVKDISDKDRPTLNESVQESVLVVSVPENLKDAVKKAEDEVKSSLPIKKSDKEFDKVEYSEPAKVETVKEETHTQQVKHEVTQDVPKKELTLNDMFQPVNGIRYDPVLNKYVQFISNEPGNENAKIVILDDFKNPLMIEEEPKNPLVIEAEPKKSLVIEEEPKKSLVIEEESKKKFEDPKVAIGEAVKKLVEEKLRKVVDDAPKKISEDTLKRVVEKVPSKISGDSAVPGDSVVKKESTRRDKEINYKQETKWAPGLVGLIGPANPRTAEKDREARLMAAFCNPGVWDSELKTCLTPGDRTSREEMAKFLKEIRFGIAFPPYSSTTEKH